MRELARDGWPDEIVISANSDMTLTSQRSRLGLCIQLGNYARLYADLLKLNQAYSDDLISCGAIILPSRDSAKVFGSNFANSHRLIRELEVFRTTILCPIAVFSLELE